MKNAAVKEPALAESSLAAAFLLLMILQDHVVRGIGRAPVRFGKVARQCISVSGAKKFKYSAVFVVGRKKDLLELSVRVIQIGALQKLILCLLDRIDQHAVAAFIDVELVKNHLMLVIHQVIARLDRNIHRLNVEFKV